MCITIDNGTTLVQRVVLRFKPNTSGSFSGFIQFQKGNLKNVKEVRIVEYLVEGTLTTPSLILFDCDIMQDDTMFCPTNATGQDRFGTVIIHNKNGNNTHQRYDTARIIHNQRTQPINRVRFKVKDEDDNILTNAELNGMVLILEILMDNPARRNPKEIADRAAFYSEGHHVPKIHSIIEQKEKLSDPISMTQTRFMWSQLN